MWAKRARRAREAERKRKPAWRAKWNARSKLDGWDNARTSKSIKNFVCAILAFVSLQTRLHLLVVAHFFLSLFPSLTCSLFHLSFCTFVQYFPSKFIKRNLISFFLCLYLIYAEFSAEKSGEQMNQCGCTAIFDGTPVESSLQVHRFSLGNHTEVRDSSFSWLYAAHLCASVLIYIHVYLWMRSKRRHKNFSSEERKKKENCYNKIE